MNRQIYLLVDNVRSCHNVGSLLRTADGLGVDKVYLTGYTPYPALVDDPRLPHLAAKLDKQIAKTALSAEKSVDWTYESDIKKVINNLKQQDFEMVALEQSARSVNLQDFKPTNKIALIVGNEVDGVESETLKLCDQVVEIPMLGKKESLNVAIATGIALHSLRYT